MIKQFAASGTKIIVIGAQFGCDDSWVGVADPGATIHILDRQRDGIAQSLASDADGSAYGRNLSTSHTAQAPVKTHQPLIGGNRIASECLERAARGIAGLPLGISRHRVRSHSGVLKTVGGSGHAETETNIAGGDTWRGPSGNNGSCVSANVCLIAKELKL